MNVTAEASEFSGTSAQSVLVFYGQAIAVGCLCVGISRNSPPNTLWFVIGLSSIINPSGTFIRVDGANLHLVQMTDAAVWIRWLGHFILIIASDQPIHGELGIMPMFYEFIREQLMIE